MKILALLLGTLLFSACGTEPVLEEEIGVGVVEQNSEKVDVQIAVPEALKIEVVEPEKPETEEVIYEDPCDDQRLAGGCSSRRGDIVFNSNYFEYAPELKDFRYYCADSVCNEVLIRNNSVSKKESKQIKGILKKIDSEYKKCFRVRFSLKDSNKEFSYTGKNPYEVCILKPVDAEWCTDTYEDCEDICAFTRDDFIDFPFALRRIDAEEMNYEPVRGSSYGYCKDEYIPGGGLNYKLLDGVITPIFLYVD